MPVYTVILKYLSVIVVGYLLGSVPMAIPVSRLLFNKDVREEGSHNAGTTNMARVYGMGAGAFTLVGDILKTVLAIWFGRILLGEPGHFCAGVAALFGHCWPVFYRFKGGKGVAVAAGLAIMADWRVALIAIGLFAVLAVSIRYVSLASLIATLAGAVLSFVLPGISVWRSATLAVMCVTVWVMHRGNIQRLLTGTEKKLTPGGKKKEKRE